MILGTANVIAACVGESVSSLIYCSSIGTVQGYFNCQGGSETELKDVRPLLFRDYGGTKRVAEQQVLKADQTPLADGQFYYNFVNSLLYTHSPKMNLTCTT